MSVPLLDRLRNWRLRRDRLNARWYVKHTTTDGAHWHGPIDHVGWAHDAAAALRSHDGSAEVVLGTREVRREVRREVLAS